MKKKVFVLLLVIFSVFLTGCEGSSVSLYYAPGPDVTTYLVEFKLANKIVEKFNDSANESGVLRKKYYLGGSEALKNTAYTIDDYIELVAGTVMGLTHVKTFSSYESTLIQFRMDVANEENTIFVQPKPEIEKDLFLYTIKNEAENPFTPYFEEYTEAETNNRTNTAMQVLQNGKWDIRTIQPNETDKIDKALKEGWYLVSGSDRDYRLDILPSLNEAFPIAKMFDATQFETIFYFLTNYNLFTSGEKLVDEDGNYYYEFRSLFGSDDSVYYEYVRANSIGWNLVAIFVGLLAVGLVFLYAKYRKKPKKLKPQEQYKALYPYDPFEENGNGGSNGNPFEGY